jgi:hypothetical protein
VPEVHGSPLDRTEPRRVGLPLDGLKGSRAEPARADPGLNGPGLNGPGLNGSPPGRPEPRRAALPGLRGELGSAPGLKSRLRLEARRDGRRLGFSPRRSSPSRNSSAASCASASCSQLTQRRMRKVSNHRYREVFVIFWMRSSRHSKRREGGLKKKKKKKKKRKSMRAGGRVKKRV